MELTTWRLTCWAVGISTLHFHPNSHHHLALGSVWRISGRSNHPHQFIFSFQCWFGPPSIGVNLLRSTIITFRVTFARINPWKMLKHKHLICCKYEIFSTGNKKEGQQVMCLCVSSHGTCKRSADRTVHVLHFSSQAATLDQLHFTHSSHAALQLQFILSPSPFWFRPYSVVNCDNQHLAYPTKLLLSGGTSNVILRNGHLRNLDDLISDILNLLFFTMFMLLLFIQRVSLMNPNHPAWFAVSAHVVALPMWHFLPIPSAVCLFRSAVSSYLLRFAWIGRITPWMWC